ncbi:MAG: AraC family transcriptional regulator [Gemmatimonadota bacterium]
MMEYQEFLPSPVPRSFVRCYWQLRGESVGESADPALPDGSPELIFNLGDSFDHLEPDGRTVRQPAAFLVGQITRPMLVRATGRSDLIAVRFEPYGAAILHDCMAELTDQWVGINSLRDGVLLPVAEQLAAADSASERVAILDAAITTLATDAPMPDARVVAAVRAIFLAHGNLRCDELALAQGLTLRSLQRLFAREVGVSPKLLTRIARFQRVFAARRDDPGSFARVAAQCGYADQSHLVRDFHDFAGMPPAELLAALPELTGFWLNQ